MTVAWFLIGAAVGALAVHRWLASSVAVERAADQAAAMEARAEIAAERAANQARASRLTARELHLIEAARVHVYDWDNDEGEEAG